MSFWSWSSPCILSHSPFKEAGHVLVQWHWPLPCLRRLQRDMEGPVGIWNPGSQHPSTGVTCHPVKNLKIFKDLGFHGMTWHHGRVAHGHGSWLSLHIPVEKICLGCEEWSQLASAHNLHSQRMAQCEIVNENSDEDFRTFSLVACSKRLLRNCMGT